MNTVTKKTEVQRFYVINKSQYNSIIIYTLIIAICGSILISASVFNLYKLTRIDFFNNRMLVMLIFSILFAATIAWAAIKFIKPLIVIIHYFEIEKSSEGRKLILHLASGLKTSIYENQLAFSDDSENIIFNGLGEFKKVSLNGKKAYLINNKIETVKEILCI